jgi:hypothetical protein
VLAFRLLKITEPVLALLRLPTLAGKQAKQEYGRGGAGEPNCGSRTHEDRMCQGVFSGLGMFFGLGGEEQAVKPP